LTVADYSQTPLPRKLGIREGARCALVGAPAGFQATLLPLPAAAHIADVIAGPLDVILLFATAHAALARDFPLLVDALAPDGGLWVAWPKRAAKLPTDLDEHIVRAVGLAAGLVDNKVCAIDETWSGLRFVVRLTDRPRRAAAPT
jgi:hypothetical protein